MAFNSLVKSFNRWRKVNQTVSELSRLDDRELDDLGISRWQIREIAHKSF
ncbi:MAG: DUF1127 domain-containing protein [Pseudomonadota bacterium]